LKTLYLAPERCAPLGEGCRGIEISPLLRELILSIAARGMIDGAKAAEAIFADMLVALLAEAEALPFSLRMPDDSRARRAAVLIQGNPASDLSLGALATHAGASIRTLQRLFVGETGVHVAEWRQTARIFAAASRLLEGGSVTEAGLVSGYATTSAFISAFRRRTGKTPLEYRDQRETGKRRGQAERAAPAREANAATTAS
jgi:AraC-like DNA-binding protein